jgi:hypothetical protein
MGACDGSKQAWVVGCAGLNTYQIEHKLANACCRRRHFHGLGGAVGVILGVLVFFQQGHEFFPRVGGDQFFGATEIRVGLPTDRQVNISMILNNKR